MDRQQLEKLSLQELQAELRKYSLAVLSNPASCIDALMSHFERNAPVDLLGLNPPDSGCTSTPLSEVSNAAIQQFLQQLIDQNSALSEQIKLLVQLNLNTHNQSAQSPHTQISGAQILDSHTLDVPGFQSPHAQSPRVRMPDALVPGASRSPPLNTSMHGEDQYLTDMTAGQAIRMLTTQIPLFGGTEDEDIELWIRKVKYIAATYGVSDKLVNLAASERLTKDAKDWHEMNIGPTTSSWASLKPALVKAFRRKVPIHLAIQKVDARKWNFSRESFQQYARQKLKLMHPLQLSERDSIQLLINGIGSVALRDHQLLCRYNSEDVPPPPVKKERGKASPPSPTKSNQWSREAKDSQCLQGYCKAKGHMKEDCFKLRRREQALSQNSTPVSSKSSLSAAEVKAATSQIGCVGSRPTSDDEAMPADPETIGCVESSQHRKFKISDTVVKIFAVNGSKSNLIALIDTGSPVSFLQSSALDSLREQLPDCLAKANFKVIDDSGWSTHAILGRDFIAANNLQLLYDPLDPKLSNRVKLMNEVASADILEDEPPHLPAIDIQTDFGHLTDQKVLQIIKEVDESNIAKVEDGYCVSVVLKDNSTFAYAPRRFAWMERLQLRKIIDDLIERGIIAESCSPYCSRVVPVRKKDGSLRLCVDLRPLNDRTIKQNYPFPVIEDCLARIGPRVMVLTLLDIRDGFHQINIHPDSTKYFSFATPDGQYEFLKLPFGYCEAPAEFQKRLIHILQPLIRQDKVLVYIEDMLIPSCTVEENLAVLKEVLILLKKYDFELNYKKCKFLKKNIEFLGYNISQDGMTLSERHVSAMRDFPSPRNVHELQRFLGLVSFFRRFIPEFAVKARPLYNLLRNGVPFEFDDICENAFNMLKSILISYPIVRLYNPSLETELHTDASSIVLAAILLQKQDRGKWTPVAYYSQATNDAESRYHSFELEMLAVVKAVERFHIYLYGIEFTVITDCHALVYALTKAHVNSRIARWTYRLQNYRFKVVHRKGEKMAHVDALSRVVASIDALPLERELQIRQLTDPHIRALAEHLESGEHEHFTLFEGLVYRKFEDKPRFYVPDSMVHNIIHRYHDESAHCRFDKTVQGILANYWFPALRNKTKKHLDNCLTCLLANSSSCTRKGEMHLTETPKLPFEIIHLDHFGPLIESRDKIKHVLVVIDACTRFTFLFPCKSTGSLEVINH
ncbi:uncharacterized protein LOC113005059 [Solenopsis invicta]|uniref:uncharacterized protein LOC113005059 n=1 Tax=Solenopsis invicta TaxID=13686 RepID=UPI00193CBE8A|nr:uncharacterized protein LOC113005059 [Solenopsis invicta]